MKRNDNDGIEFNSTHEMDTHTDEASGGLVCNANSPHQMYNTYLYTKIHFDPAVFEVHYIRTPAIAISRNQYCILKEINSVWRKRAQIALRCVRFERYFSIMLKWTSYCVQLGSRLSQSAQNIFKRKPFENTST